MVTKRSDGRWKRLWMAALVVGSMLVLAACSTDDAPIDSDENQVRDISGDADIGEHQGEDLDAGEDVGGDGGTQPGRDTREQTDTEEAPDAAGQPDAGQDADAGEQADVGEEPDGGFDPTVGDTCEDAIDVTEGGVWTGESTIDMTDQYDPSMNDCSGTNFSDNDRVYVVAPQEDRDYEIRVEPVTSDFDAMIYVRHDCSAEECVAATRLNGAGEPETLTFEATGGIDNYIIVDGEIGSTGNFDLMVTVEES